MNNTCEKWKARHYWPQFSLRSLFVAVLVISSCVSLIAAKINSKRRERRVVAEIEALGGAVQYDWQRNERGLTPPGPRWLRTLLGDDFFAYVEVLDFDRQDRQVADADLVRLDLEGLTHLQMIDITSNHVTDAGLARVAELLDLQSLVLCHSLIVG